VLGNTFSVNAALGQLRAEGYPVRGEDLTRLSRSRAATWACTAATGSRCLASPAAFAYCVTRTPKTTTGSGSEAASR